MELILDKETKGKTLISGFHGVGLVGVIAVHHMVKELKAERIGFVEDEKLPLFVSVKGKALSYPVEIYEKGDIHFLQISPKLDPETANSLVKKLMEKEWEFFLIGGLDEKFRKGKKMKGVSVNCPLPEGTEWMEEGLLISGPLASFLTYAKFGKKKAKAILPYAKRKIPDPNAASDAIEKVEELFGVKIDKSKLEEDAKKIEEELKKFESRMKKSESPAMFR